LILGITISPFLGMPTRCFLATRYLRFEGESKITFVGGNFSKHKERSKQTLGGTAAQDHVQEAHRVDSHHDR